MGPGVEELLGHKDSRAGPITCRATLKLGKWCMYHGRVQDLVKSIDVSELGIWVVRRMSVANTGDLCKVFCFGAILLHILPPSISKALRHRWTLVHSSGFVH